MDPVSTLQVLRGPRFCGKTDAALRELLASAVSGQPGILLSFRSSPDFVLARAGALGYDARRMTDLGLVRLECSPPETAAALRRLNRAAAEIRVLRLVVDDIEATAGGDVTLGRLHLLARPLWLWARARGATTVLTLRDEGVPALERLEFA